MGEYRRRLPHFHPDGAYLFVTWRLAGSLPVAPPDVVYATPGHAFAAQDRGLAQGHGRCWLSDPRVAHLVVETIRAGETQVAPRRITHWIKGRTAYEANWLLGRTGTPFWQDESYIIRSLGEK